MLDRLRSRLVFAWADLTDWAMPWRPLARELDGVRLELKHVRAVVRRHGIRITTQEARMSTFEETAAELARLTDEMADKLEASEKVNAELLAAVQRGDQDEIEALAKQSAEHTAVVQAVIDRLRGAGTDPSNPLPDPSPLPDPAPPVDEPGTDEPGTDPEPPVAQPDPEPAPAEEAPTDGGDVVTPDAQDPNA